MKSPPILVGAQRPGKAREETLSLMVRGARVCPSIHVSEAPARGQAWVPACSSTEALMLPEPLAREEPALLPSTLQKSQGSTRGLISVILFSIQLFPKYELASNKAFVLGAH